MKDEHIQKELLRIAQELEELFELAQEDFTLDKSRYTIGVMVGLEYARIELNKILGRLYSTVLFLVLFSYMM